MINDLATVKQHLRVSSNDEDDLIGLYMDAAEDWIKNYIDGIIPLFPPEPEDWDPEALDTNGFEVGAYPTDLIGTVYPSIKSAHLLIVGGLYENRESQTAGVTIANNPAVVALLFPYRKKLGV